MPLKGCTYDVYVKHPGDAVVVWRGCTFQGVQGFYWLFEHPDDFFMEFGDADFLVRPAHVIRLEEAS